MQELRIRSWLLCTAALLAAIPALWSGATVAQDENGEDETQTYGRRVVIDGAVTTNVDREVKSTAKELQKRADQEGRQSVLVLEIHDGQSSFGQVSDLAEFLTSPEIARVRTVAWISEGERVDGNNAVLALACREIIMHPDAELGDIGEGRAVSDRVRQGVLALVEKRHNRKVTPALALGMMDPQQAVYKATITTGKPPNTSRETRIVSAEELQKLQREIANIEWSEIKPAGQVGRFSGVKANEQDVLVVRTAQSIQELAAIYGVPTRLLRRSAAADRELNVALIRVRDMIEPVMESFIERQIDRAVENGVSLIIFEINSPGGYLQPSERLAFRIADLDPEKVRTVAWVPKGAEAISGAAIIAFGCDEVHLHPDSQIGDAGPIEIRPGQPAQFVEPKFLSKVRATLKTLAEKKNRPPALLEAMADKDLEVFRVTHRDNPRRVWYMTEEELARDDAWVKGPLVPETREDNLLTVSGRRAHELGLAQRPVENLEELKAELGIPADMKLHVLEQTWVDKLIFLLNTEAAMYILLVLAIIALYLELHFTTGLFGIIAVLCFGLFFWSRVLGGTAGWLEVVLFILGLGCIALEIFVIPGFGVFGISGGLMLLGSLVLASQTFGNMEPGRDLQMLTRTAGTLAASVVSVVILAMILSRFLPRIPLFNQLILAPPGAPDTPGSAGPRLRPEYVDPMLAMVGKKGVTISVLRPAGKAEIDGEYRDVVSEGPYIDRGAAVVVVDVAGNRVVVREIEES